jgi:hypothetical protein
MNTDAFKGQLVDVIEMGVPLATLANTIQLASVMEGIHSVDVGILMIPIIVELLITIADSQGAKYQTGMEGMENERATAPNRKTQYERRRNANGRTSRDGTRRTNATYRIDG